MTGFDSDSARVHWVLLGSFSAAPSGRSVVVTRDTFGEMLTKHVPTLQGKVEDRLGPNAERAFSFPVTALSSLTLTGVVKAIPELAALAAFADKVGGSMTIDAVLNEIEKHAGQGKLSAACAAEAEGATPISAAAPATVTGSSLLDDTLAATQNETTLATSAVNAFVSALRPANAQKSGTSVWFKKVRALVEAAVFGTARDILNSPEVAAAEGTWRGLRLLLDHAPKAAGIHVELVDIEPAKIPAFLRDREELDSLDDPDAFFVIDSITDVALLTELAAVGEEKLAPVVVSPSTKLFGANENADLGAIYEKTAAGFDAWWLEITKSDAARWLCAVTNRIVVTSEGAGAAKRTAFANPVWAIATMLSASFHAQGSFARVLSNAGAIKAAGTFSIPDGYNAGLAVPTEAFYSTRQQGEFADRGIVAIGSPRNSDMIMLSQIPTVFVGTDPSPLPAQILSGRIVRFARWARTQIDPTAGDEAGVQLFEQAADVFLFPGMQKVAQVKASIGAAENGQKVLGVMARVHSSHALMQLEISFGLPLRM